MPPWKGILRTIKDTVFIEAEDLFPNKGVKEKREKKEQTEGWNDEILFWNYY